MEKASVIKLLDAGFVFLRVDDKSIAGNDKHIIKYSDDFGVWKKLGEYPTMAACKRELEKLISENPKYLF